MTTTETEAPSVKRYRKKPVEIEARLFDPAASYDEACAVIAWCGGTATDDGCEISTLEGVMLARPGDWIIRGVVGEFYPRRGDVFALTYEAAEDAPQEDSGDAVDEITRLRNACQLLGQVLTGHGRAMEAARIEMAQGSTEKAMQWILNSLPDVWDDEETEWNGTETANEWWDRTDVFYRAEKPAATTGETPVSHPGERSLEEVIKRYESGQPARDQVEQAEFDHLAACADEPEDGAE